MARFSARDNQYLDPFGQVPALVRQVSAGASVLVWGPPGVGKSRLLRECLRVLAREDAVLVSVRDALSFEAFLAQVAEAVGCALPPTGDADDWQRRVGAALVRRRPALLALDHLEQLPGRADAAIAAWSQQGCTLLLASRRLLTPSTITAVELRRLPVDRVGPAWSPAAELLRARASENTGALLEEDDAAAVHAIARAVDGVPLALELIAAKLGILTPAEAFAQLGERNAAEEAPLEHGIRTSYELLGEPARICLHAAATFRGGFTFEAIRTVVGPAVPVLDAMETLRSQSLLVVERRGDAMRFDLLASVRKLAEREARRDPASWSLVCERHASATRSRFARLLSELAPAARLREERENLRAAFARAEETHAAQAGELALLLTLPRLGLAYAEVTALTARALALPVVPDAARAELLLRRGTALRFEGQLAAAAHDLEAAQHLAERVGNDRVRAEALAGLGNVASVTSDWKTGRAYLERALAVHPGPEFRALGLTMVANTFCNEDDHATAEPMMREAAAHGAPESLPGATARLALGVLLVEKGELGEAFALLTDASAALRAHAHWRGIALTYLGRIRHESGFLTGALQLYEEARACIDEAGVQRARAVLDLQCGLLFLELGELDAADASLRSALLLTRDTCPDHQGFVLAAQGVLAVCRGAGADRERLFQRAEAALAPYSRPIFAAAIATLRGASRASLAAELRDTSDVRWASRMLAKLQVTTAGPTLLVGAAASWFRFEGQETTSLARRKAIQHILDALVRERLEHPGALVSIEALVRVGWPGASLVPGSGTERVYAAVATLRRLGLRGVLEQEGQGYRLAVDTPVVAHAGVP